MIAPERRRWLARSGLDDTAIALGLAALAAVIALGGWAWRLDRLVYDLGLSLWQRPPPPGMLIVAIDDASVEAIGRWPWPRAVHATLLEQVALARPRAVLLDLVLSEPDPDPAQDRLLTRALVRAAPVVLPVTWHSPSGSALSALEPAEPMRSAVQLGSAEAPVDSDGVLRHAFLHAGPAAQLYPHLALALLQAGGEALPAKLPIDPSPDPSPDPVARAPANRHDRLLIRYAGPPGTVERVSYVDVLRGAVAPERLRGRYVLIGMTAQGLGDTLATPVNGTHVAMPGVEVLANTLYTLRSGDTLSPVDERLGALLSAAAVAALLWAFGRFGARAALPLALGSVPLAVLASLLALRQGVWLSPAPYATAALLAYPLWSWRRLERTVKGLDEEIARIAAEPSTARLMRDRRSRRGDLLETRLQTLQWVGALVRQAHGFLVDTLAAMPTAMLVADEKARVALANPQAAALFEVDDAVEMQGLDLVRLLSEFSTAEPVDWAQVLSLAQPRTRPGAETAVEARLAGGDYVIHVAAIELQGQWCRVITLADVAPVKQAQAYREETLAFVSHDLRTPATEIVLLADLHLAGRLHTPQNTLLLELRRLAARTLDLSEDFVRASQVQQQLLQPTPVTPEVLLNDALADHRVQALAAGVTLHVQASEATHTVQLDRALATRAIGNLVSNAIRHSPPGTAVLLHAALEGTRLVVSVRDHGAGLSDAQHQQLARGDEGASVQHVRGVGLGLLFVQRVAQRHGGSLRAQRPGDGNGALMLLELHELHEMRELPAQTASADPGHP